MEGQSKLVALKGELEDNGVSWYGYFDGTPTAEELFAAYRCRYATSPPERTAYSPERCDDAVAQRAGLQRWFLCQAV